MGLKSMLYAMGLGAGLMYLYDPEHGEGRREQIQGRWSDLRQNTKQYVNHTSQELGERAEGARANLQSFASSAKADGTGGIRPQQVAQQVRQKWSERVNASGQASGWSPDARLAASIAGGGLALIGLLRGGLKGTAMTFFGADLLARGVNGSSLPDLLGMNQGDGRSLSHMTGAEHQASGSDAEYGQTNTADMGSSRAGRRKGSGSPQGVGASDRMAQPESLRGAAAPPASKPQTGAPSWGESRAGGRGGSEEDAGQETGGFDSMIPGAGKEPSAG